MGKTWQEYKELLKGLPRHLMTGQSYMLPVVVSGGVWLALSMVFAGAAGVVPKTGFLSWWAEIGKAGMMLFVPVFAAYVAFSMVDRPGIGPALIGGYLAQTKGAGYLGGLLAGILAGSIIFFLKKLVNVPHRYAVIKSILIMPLVTTIIVGIVIIATTAPISAGMNQVSKWLQDNYQARVMVSAVQGVMCAFDMGGPLNKTSAAFGHAMAAQKNFGPYGVNTAMYPLPSLAMVLAVLMNRRKYTAFERGNVPATFFLYMVSISEGAIPYAIADPLRVIPGLCIGGLVGGAMAGAFGLTSYIPWGSLIALPGVNKPLLHLLSTWTGALVAALVINFLKKPVAEETED
jgi:fructose-specific PTS system IIC-like component